MFEGNLQHASSAWHEREVAQDFILDVKDASHGGLSASPGLDPLESSAHEQGACSKQRHAVVASVEAHLARQTHDHCLDDVAFLSDVTRYFTLCVHLLDSSRPDRKLPSVEDREGVALHNRDRLQTVATRVRVRVEVVVVAADDVIASLHGDALAVPHPDALQSQRASSEQASVVCAELSDDVTEARSDATIDVST